jgi:hypothetical protein
MIAAFSTVDSSTLRGLTRAERVPSADGRETGTDRGRAGFFRQHHPNDSPRPQGGGIRLELHAASPSVVARVIGRHLQYFGVASGNLG